MIIEFFPEGKGASPLVLIFGRDWEQCQTFCEMCEHLAQGTVKRAALHSLPGFECAGGCQLWAKVAPEDAGIAKPREGLVFECALTRASWARMAELLQPLCRPQPEETEIVHQLDKSGPVSLKIATAREW